MQAWDNHIIQTNVEPMYKFILVSQDTEYILNTLLHTLLYLIP